jgi:PLD-like domain
MGPRDDGRTDQPRPLAESRRMIDDAAERIDRMARQNRQAVTLARLLSFAVLIEPALMRATRLELLPNVDVGAEADLWFGPLAQTRSRDGIVMVPGVAERLRAGLEDNLAERSWRITERLHDYLPPAVRLEEKLNWLSLDPAGNAQEITELLQSALSALLGQARDEVANWAGRALPRLSRAVRETEGAAMLAAASDLRLGRTATLTEHLRGRQIPDWFASVVPAGLANAELGISVTAAGMTFDPTPSADAQRIKVPATDPRVVQISARRESQIVFVDAKTARFVPLSFDDGPIELTTIAGEAFTLERTSASTEKLPDRVLACAAYANCNQALIVWQVAAPIERCLGFALERLDAERESEFLKSMVGFPRANPQWGPQPSAVSPIQRFMWTDQPTKRGVPYSYRITPVVGVPNKVELVKDLALETPQVDVAAKRQGPVTGVFNRGPSAPRPQSRETRSDRAAREEFGGEVRRALLPMLMDAGADERSTVYAALLDLEDRELVEALIALGRRANIILSRDPVAARNSEKLANARKALAAAQFYIRSKAQRFTHTNFMVVCDGDGKPKTVWTGSLNWTSAALYGRDSNALVIDDAAIAARYLDQWQRLSADPSAPDIMAANAKPADFTLADGSRARLWFAPVRNGADLAELRGHLAAARYGILFAMGPRGRKSIIDDILQVSGRVYVAGVAPSLDAGRQITVHQHGTEARVAPERVPSDAFGIVGLRMENVRMLVGSRLIVIDPFSDDAVVIAGSHGLSDGASRMNDDDLLIIQGNRDLAAQCAVHIKGLIDHYAFRAHARASKARTPLVLRPDDGWQRPFMTGEHEKEIRFWIGLGSEVRSAPQDIKALTTAPRSTESRSKKSLGGSGSAAFSRKGAKRTRRKTANKSSTKSRPRTVKKKKAKKKK